MEVEGTTERGGALMSDALDGLLEDDEDFVTPDYSQYELNDSDDEEVEEVEEVEESKPPAEPKGTSTVITFDDLDEEEDSSSSEERLRTLGDELLASLLKETDTGLERRRALFSTVRTGLFKDENYVLYKILYGLKDRNLVPDEEFLGLYLTRNRKILLEADGKHIDITAYGEVEDDSAAGYTAGLLKHFRRLKAIPELSESDFNLVLEKYRLEFQGVETEKLLYDSLEMLTEGTKKQSGFDDASDNIRRGLGEIAGLVDSNQGSGFVSLKDVISEDSSISQMYKICDFGEIEELNKHLGGVYSSMLYTVLAPPKSGKSKFVARIAHNAAVLEGQNVSIWAPEGGPQMWAAQLRAIHFDHTYNSLEDSRRISLGVDQMMVLRGNFSSDEVKMQEKVSAQDLVTNPEYGKIDFIDRPFKLETFLDEIDTSIKANGSSLLVIDYMQLLSSDRQLAKREILSQAYPMLLDYAKKNNIAVVSPGQLTQEAVKELAKGTSSGEMRTAGGESSEIIRSSDVVFALWASTEDLLHNRSTLLSVPTRIAPPYDPIPMYVDLGSCSFFSLSGD